MTHAHAVRGIVATVMAALVVTGCDGGFIGVDRVGPSATSEQIGINALTAGRPSAASALVLRGHALEERFDDDPHATLEELRRIAVVERRREYAVAIAELSFLAAMDDDNLDTHLAAACFAWFALFDTDLGPMFSPFDPRVRLCCDLYNRTVSEAFKNDDGDVAIVPGARLVGDSPIDIGVDLRKVGFDLTRLSRFVPASEYRVVGIANRHRTSGLGASLLAVQPRDTPAPRNTREALSRPTCAAASLILRFDGGLDELIAGELSASLEVHQPSLETSVVVGETRVPLEYDVTATIAYFMEGTRLLDFELRTFLGSDPADEYFGLFTPFPYAPGRVPIVFIHGTNSSLPRWSSMLNDLLADPELRGTFQPWFFLYPSGIPIGLSADRMRRALVDARQHLDPNHEDAALDSMLVIGHSQGGLLARHMVVDDKDHRIWSSIFTKGLDELDLEPEAREAAKRVFFSEPLPSVRRALYICTPHRGSYQADRWIVQFVNGLITLPTDVLGVATDVLTHNRDAVVSGMQDNVPGSLNGMRTTNPYLLTLAGLPAAKGVIEHCICAIDGDDMPPHGGDGVVKYESANLAGAASTYWVRDWHSCQGNPLVVNEVRRVIREHVAEFRTRHPTVGP